MIRFLRAAAVAAPALAAVALAVPAASASTTATLTATTTFVTHSDSGNHGNWATDAFTRTAKLTADGLTSSPNCKTLNPCYRFTGVIADSGTFATLPGASSPQAGVKLPAAAVDGTMKGGFAVTFYADSNAISTVGVLKHVNGDAATTTSAWFQQFFTGTPHFVGYPSAGNWSWTYKAASTCEQWVDAYDNSDGSLPADGDITGVSKCVAPVASVLTAKDVCGPWNHRVWSVTNSAGGRTRTGWIATYVWHGRYWKLIGHLRLAAGQTGYITAHQGVKLRVGFWNGLGKAGKFVYTYANDHAGPAC